MHGEGGSCLQSFLMLVIVSGAPAAPTSHPLTPALRLNLYLSTSSDGFEQEKKPDKKKKA